MEPTRSPEPQSKRAYGKDAKRQPVVNDDSALWRKEQEGA